jgi:alkanesulfonate monooxygenase SsuD/methylene tetrahydromethanopterin reductase-like flavin-dependent oxidoreductase (luciferase family)
MEFAVNIPTSVGAGEYTSLLFCDEITWDGQREFGREIEDFGFDGLSVPDHLMTGDGATMECLTTTTALAEATDDVYLYPKTINNPLRHGPYLAKAMATLDNVSDGRLKLGMGAGWKADEAVAFGYEWDDAPTRLRELEETIELTKRLWTEDEVTYDGDFVGVTDAVCKPHPKQDPHPPVMVGGGGEEFTLRITAKHADAWNYWGPPHVIEHKLSVLREHCNTYDTDYDAIQTSWFARCVIRETEAEVEEILETVPRFRRPDDLSDLEDGEYNNLVGTPEQIIDNLARYEAFDLGEVVVEFVDYPRTTGAELFADEVIPAFA